MNKSSSRLEMRMNESKNNFWPSYCELSRSKPKSWICHSHLYNVTNFSHRISYRMLRFEKLYKAHIFYSIIQIELSPKVELRSYCKFEILLMENGKNFKTLNCSGKWYIGFSTWFTHLMTIACHPLLQNACLLHSPLSKSSYLTHIHGRWHIFRFFSNK